jgi:hypothetical protein
MFFLRSFWARIRRVDKQINPLLNEVKPSGRAFHRHQNEQVYSNVHQAVIQYVQYVHNTGLHNHEVCRSRKGQTHSRTHSSYAKKSVLSSKCVSDTLWFSFRLLSVFSMDLLKKGQRTKTWPPIHSYENCSMAQGNIKEICFCIMGA